MYYRTSQEQMNNVLAFAMFLMFGGLMVGMVKSMFSSTSEHREGGTGDHLAPLLSPMTVPELAPHSGRKGKPRPSRRPLHWSIELFVQPFLAGRLSLVSKNLSTCSRR